MEHNTVRWFKTKAGDMYHKASVVMIRGEQRALCSPGVRLYVDTMTDRPHPSQMCLRCLESKR